MYSVTMDAQPDHQLREAKSLLSLAARLGRLGAWAVELPSRRLVWSPEVCAIHEVPPGFECSVDEAVAFYAPEHQPVLRAAYRACASEGRPYDLELRIHTARGRVVWIRAIAEAERGPDGTIHRVAGSCQDITRHKLAAEEYRRLATRHATTLESLTEPFFTMDCEWRITYANSVAASAFQRSSEDLIGRGLWDLFPEARGSSFEVHYRQALLTGRAVVFEAFYAPLALWAQVRAYPSPQGLAVSFRDVTEQRHAEQEVRRLHAELEERVVARTAELHAANRELEVIAFSIAHDLRMPLTAIHSFATVLQEDEAARLTERGQQHLRRILEAARQMADMTRSLLELAQLSGAPLRREPVDLAEIAREVLGSMQTCAPTRAVDLRIEEELEADADRTLVKQALANLLGNAWKFTAHAPAACIEFGARTGPDGERVFFVRDNGAGFDMARAERLFEPFCRLHGQHEFEGTGVGLATVRKIIDRHEGRIWAESEPGHGAVFYFTLRGPSARRMHQGRQEDST